MIPGAPPIGYGGACSADGFLATFAFELLFGAAGEGDKMLPFLPFFWLARLEELPDLLPILPFAAMAFDGVTGGEWS